MIDTPPKMNCTHLAHFRPTEPKDENFVFGTAVAYIRHGFDPIRVFTKKRFFEFDIDIDRYHIPSI